MKLSTITTSIVILLTGQAAACATKGAGCGAAQVGQKECACLNTQNLVKSGEPARVRFKLTMASLSVHKRAAEAISECWEPVSSAEQSALHAF